jgi:inner membrane protein
VPTIFSHAIFATTVGRACVSEPVPLRFWILTALCAILPDVDAISFAFGIRYDDLFGHRGITHSIFFAVLVGLFVGLLVDAKAGRQQRLKYVGYFTLVTLSHPVLDAMTNGGRGVAFFAPFSNSRYFFPFRPIEVSPIGMRFFSYRGLEALSSEILWVWLPACVILVSVILYRKRNELNRDKSSAAGTNR